MKFIADLGWNFVGDLALAEQMIKAASESGADYAKFQVWNPDNLKDGPWDNDGRRQIYQKAFLDKQKILYLKDLCHQHQIHFLASVFELNSLELLNSITSDVIKIPSHECNNYALVDKARHSFKEVFLSVGSVNSSDFDEIQSRYSNDPAITLMHCVSSYPLQASNVNLPKLIRLKSRSGKVGFSSHYTGIEDAIVATSLGSCLIEKHFTIDRELPGRDNKFALLPTDFSSMVNSCRQVQKMMFDHGDDLQESELDVVNVMRGRWNGK